MTLKQKQQQQQEEEEELLPFKFVEETIQLNIKCRIHYVDMEGLSDGRSIKTIVPMVMPRKLVNHFSYTRVIILTQLRF